jgi:hypothetical protein
LLLLLPGLLLLQLLRRLLPSALLLLQLWRLQRH